METIANSLSLPTMMPQSPLTELQLLSQGSEQQRIDGAAQEFESVFLSLLLKEMRNTLDTKDGGLFGSEETDSFGGMFDMFMGQHLAEAQPLGIADAIKTYFDNSPKETRTPVNPQNQPTLDVPQ